MTGIEGKEEKHQLEYSIYSCRVSWCPICNQHFFNERNVSHTTVATKQHYHTVNTSLSSLPVQEGEKGEVLQWVKPVTEDKRPEKFKLVIVRSLLTGRIKKADNMGHNKGWEVGLEYDFLWDNTEWLNEHSTPSQEGDKAPIDAGKLEKKLSDYERILNIVGVPKFLIDNPELLNSTKPTDKDIEWTKEKITSWQAQQAVPVGALQWVRASERNPNHNKHVFAKDEKGNPLTAFYVKDNTYEIEFEDNDDLPEYVHENSPDGPLRLKEGWYEECENTGYFDTMIYKRNVVEWLDDEATVPKKEEGNQYDGGIFGQSKRY